MNWRPLLLIGAVGAGAFLFLGKKTDQPQSFGGGGGGGFDLFPTAANSGADTATGDGSSLTDILNGLLQVNGQPTKKSGSLTAGGNAQPTQAEIDASMSFDPSQRDRNTGASLNKKTASSGGIAGTTLQERLRLQSLPRPTPLGGWFRR